MVVVSVYALRVTNNMSASLLQFVCRDSLLVTTFYSQRNGVKEQTRVHRGIGVAEWSSC